MSDRIIKAKDLRPGDEFTYLVLSTAGDYERHCIMLNGRKFRDLGGDVDNVLEIKNPGAPVSLVFRPGRASVEVPNGR